MAPDGPSLTVEVEILGRPLLEPHPVVVRGVLEEFRCFLENVIVLRPLMLGLDVVFLGFGAAIVPLVNGGRSRLDRGLMPGRRLSWNHAMVVRLRLRWLAP